jgi:hypothetical protein
MSSLIGLRRKAPRKTCSIEARVLHPDRPSIPCIIRDVTPDGARIAVEGRVEADKILLLIPSIAEAWVAAVRWRRGQTLGVQFVRGAADLPDDASTAEPDAFALRLQTAQLARTSKRIAAA